MEIWVIGPGCARCRAALEEAQRAVPLAGVAVVVVKVDDLRELMTYRGDDARDRRRRSVEERAGRVPRATEIAAWLTEGSGRGGRRA